MPEAAGIPDFNSRVVEHARKDFPLLDADMIVAEALDRIRREGIGERVIYFFAVDADKRLVGVLPTRRLLTAPLDTPLHEIMVRRVIAIPASASVLDACEFFVLYKFFAFPVVDEHRHVVGVIDASLFADEILQAGESEDRRRPAAPVRDDIFEILGFHLEQIRGASARIYHRPSAWLELRERRCSNSLVLEKRPSQRRRHWRKHRAFPGDCLVVWSWGAVVFASAQAGSENCGRPNYARPRRYLRARSLFHGCAPGFAMRAVSVIIPALNEEEPIANVVRECLATKISSEIIVVDNGSNDRTGERARE